MKEKSARALKREQKEEQEFRDLIDHYLSPGAYLGFEIREFIKNLHYKSNRIPLIRKMIVDYKDHLLIALFAEYVHHLDYTDILQEWLCSADPKIVLEAVLAMQNLPPYAYGKYELWLHSIGKETKSGKLRSAVEQTINHFSDAAKLVKHKKNNYDNDSEFRF